MKNTTKNPTRASRPALVPDDAITLGSSPRAEDAPHYVALEHTSTASCALDSCERNLSYASWIASRVRIGVPSETESGYGIELRIVLSDGNGKNAEVELVIASENDGPVSALTPTEFRRIVAALNAAAAQLPDIPEPGADHPRKAS